MTYLKLRRKQLLLQAEQLKKWLTYSWDQNHQNIWWSTKNFLWNFVYFIFFAWSKVGLVQKILKIWFISPSGLHGNLWNKFIGYVSNCHYSEKLYCWPLRKKKWILPFWREAISLTPPWSQVVELDGGSFGIVKTLCAGEVALQGHSYITSFFHTFFTPLPYSVRILSFSDPSTPLSKPKRGMWVCMSHCYFRIL